jgi:serine/threonine protein kinase/Tfp pilus assembly protein PilF
MSVTSVSPSERELRFQEVAALYLEARETGRSEALSALLAQHPDLADDLAAFVAGQDELAHLAAPLRNAVELATWTEQVQLSGTLGDFRILREIGRGGMGIVYEAEQVSLNRRVALKVLPFAATLDSRHLLRFQNEARAAAQLHHTNIVPVFAVGSERGVHYYAMQYIEGHSLADVIAYLRASGGRPPASDPSTDETTPYPDAIHRLAGASRSPETAPVAALSTIRSTKDTAYFRTVAQLSIQAAEALDHAHQQGIVHRDVKPANLMVDAVYRLWVTDFGLAQIQSDTRLTLTGDLVGTLRYMSPEQALAKRAVVDHRTDIYSLGVTLYELLTLEPAFRGTDRQELLRQIAYEEPRPPRRLNKAIPAELETIVLKALERNPADRYATAQAVADDLRHWLEDRPIQARQPSLALRARKWARRHRPVVASLAAGLLTLLLVGVVLGWGYQRRLAQTEQAVTAALAQAETHLDAGDRLIDQPERWQATARLAQAALEKAEELLAAGVATAALRERAERDRAAVEAALVDSGLLLELNRIRLELATTRRGRHPVAACAVSYARALGSYGVGPEAAESAGERIRGSRLRMWLVAAMEDWWRVCDDDGSAQRLERVLAAADPAGDFRARWREAVGRRDGAALAKMAVELATQRLPPAVACSRAADLTSLNQWAAAERLLKAALARDPADFWLNHDLGMALEEQGPARAEEAVGYLRAALVLRSNSAAVHLHMGLALEDKGDLDGAIGCCHAALKIDPNDAHVHNNLGILLMSKGRVGEAIRCFQRAIAIDPKDAYAHNNLGNAFWASEKRDEAIASFQQALAIDPKYYDALVNLGSRLQSIERIEEASEYLKRAVAAEPSKTDPKLAIAHYNLGNALRDQGRLDEAVDEYRAAFRLRKDYAEAHCNLGLVLLKQGKFQKAAVELRRGHELGSQQPGWRYPSEEWVRNAESLAEDAEMLPRSEAQPGPEKKPDKK